jgi:hypothetical protein
MYPYWIMVVGRNQSAQLAVFFRRHIIALALDFVVGNCYSIPAGDFSRTQIYVCHDEVGNGALAATGRVNEWKIAIGILSSVVEEAT